ncbi:MAG: isopeptide-forming domain-containing fimbrial protein [Pseudomonadota bacterium]
MDDPNIGQSVTGTSGSSLIILNYPVGSVVTGGPDLPIEICLTIAPSADVGVPLPIDITPVYEFGDTATGDNGPIIAPVVNQNVTPTVLLFDKEDNAPESERPPGTSWPYDYTLTVDIANTATINPLTISDTLPADFQFNGTLNIVGGVGCAATQTPSTVTPGGVLEVTCTGNTVGTTSASDVTVTYSGSIIDTLDETVCTTEDQVNAASAEGTYVPPSGPVQPLPAILDSTTVVAKHVAVQKGVSPNLVSPSAALTYTLNFQVTDFGDADALVVTDTIPDGIDFVSHGSLTVNGGGAIAIAPSVNVNGDFTTTVIYDIAAAAGMLTAGSAITLTYNAELRQDYQDTGEPILSSDSLNNTVVADYDLAQGASGCSDGSGATVDIIPVNINKQIINPQPFYVPGEQVQFRLTLNVPAGDTQNIVFEDFQPLPVIDVTDLNLTFGGPDIVVGPNDTAGLTPTDITIDPAQNLLAIEWPNLSSITPEVIEVDVFATINDDPFADGLFLTNILNVSTNNTPGATAVSTGPVSFQVGAPDLVITKGVSATDGNGLIEPAPATLPVDGDITGADAGDQITYQITVENIGSAQAFDVLVTDPGAAELTGCSVASVTDGTGSPLANGGDLFTTGLTLADPLAANDNNPAGGGAPFGADTALITVNCDVVATVEPSTNFFNTATADWASQPGANDFPTISDDATVSINDVGLQKFFVLSSEPGTSDGANPPRATIGEIVRYRLALRVPEGQISDLSLRDSLPNGLRFLDDGTARVAFVSNGAGLSASGFGPIVNVNGNAAGVGAVASTSVTTAIPGSAISGGPFNSGTDPIFSFGTITNNDRDGDNEFLLVEFNALVQNAGQINIGGNRNNSFSAQSGGIPLADPSANVQIRIAEPQVDVGKSASPTTGDAGDVITFTVTVVNAGGANSSPAYEVVLTDSLPTGLEGLSVSSITPSGCLGLGTNDTSTATTLDIFFAEMAPGCSVAIEFTATLGTGVAPGTTITNTAGAIWTSLPGPNGTPGNQTGSTVPGTAGSSTGERDGSGGLNDYSDSGSANVNIPGVGITKSVTATSETETGSGEFRPAVDDLVIGEQATFTIVATLPEGTTPQVIISDTLPFTNGVMRLDSAAVLPLPAGTNLTPDTASPVPSISDAQLSDGIDDTVSFNFGQVINTADGVVDDNDRIVIEVVATLVNESANSNGDELTNTALVQFGPGLDASASAEIDVVEPILEIQKDGSITDGDAGDPVTYMVTIDHATASAADAQDLVFQDVLPAGLTLNVGSISVTSGPNFDANTSAGNTIALGWTDLLQSETIVLEYEAVLNNTVAPGETVTNTANIEWTSIAGPNPDERTNDVSNAHQILITQPGLGKLVFETSELSTATSQFGTPDDLTIGEQVTYRFTVVFPEGTSSDAVVTDQLPTGSSVLQVVSSRIVSIGGNTTVGNTSGGNLSGGSLPAIGDAGTASDTNGDSVNDLVTWNLGEVLNTPDGSPTAADEIEFEVVAVVLDVAANQSGDVDQLNTATLTTADTTVSGTAPIDLVAPEVDLSKTVTDPVDGFVDAGDTVTVRLDIDHTSDSTADAFNLILTDTLPTGLTWAANVNSDCIGLVTDASGAPVIGFSLPTLDLTTDTCFIEYEVTVDASVSPGQTLQNSAVLDYDSTPVFVAGQTRRAMSSDVANVTVIAPSLVKVAVDTSQPDTGLSQGDPALRDLTIGETVTYELTLVFPEGVTTNAVLTDLMPISPGVIEAIGATVTAVGGTLNTSLPGTPVLSETQNGDGLNDTVTLDFGTVTNPPDGEDDANDRIVVEIVGRVVDVPANVDGIVLSNNATLNFDGDGGGLNSSADIEVVEPLTNLSKSMTLGEDGLVTITLTVENTGTAPAYDLRVIDVFDEAVWDLSGFSPVSVSTGFDLNLLPATPAAGQQTVEFQTNAGAVSPDGTIPAGASVSATFEVQLAALPPDPNPVENTAEQVGGDSLPDDDDNERDLPPDDDTAQLGVPALTLSKTATLQVDADMSSSVSPGDTLRYTLVLENTGQGDASNIVIDDTPDANTQLLVGSVTTSSGTVNTGNTTGDTVVQVGIPALAATQTVTITFDVVINNPLPTGVNQIVNQAVFDSTELPPGESDDPGPPNPDDPTVVPLGNTAPDLTIVKDDGGASTTPGGTVSWTLSYENVGNQDATGVVITDTVPDNSTFNAGASTTGWVCAPDDSAGSVCTFDIGNVDAGTGDSITFVVTVDSPLPAGVDELSNSASIADDGNNGPDPTPGNNEDDDTTPVTAAPDLSIVKDDGGITAVPAGLVVYTLSYENVGTQNATGVAITDVVPPNSTFVAGSSTVGWSCTPDDTAGSSCVFSLGTVNVGDSGIVQFAVQLNDPLPLDFDSLPNTASIADDGTNGPDPTPDDNIDTENTPVTIDPALGIAKVLSDAPDPIVAGSLLEYTITATNIGNITLTNVVVTDDLITPTGGTTPCASVAPGGTCTLIGTYLATSDDVENGEIINIATADSDQTEPVGTTVTTPVPQNPALGLVKEAVLDDSNGNGLGDAGETINYTITTTNIGDVTLNNVVVLDPLLDELVCNPTIPATLAPTEIIECTGSYLIEIVDLAAGAITNVATASGEGPGGTPVDDGDSTVTVLNAPMAVPTLSVWALLLLSISLLMLGAGAQLRRS